MITLDSPTELGPALSKPGLTPVLELPNYLWVPYERPCMYCDEPTTWVEINFEGPLHPGHCNGAMWQVYIQAERVAYMQGLCW